MESIKTLNHPVITGKGHAEACIFGVDGRPGDEQVMIERLKSDLLRERNENRQLVDALRSLHSQFNSLQMHADKQSELLLCGGEELQDARQRAIAMRRELDRIHREYAQLQGQADGGNRKDITDTEKCNAVLRARMEELQKDIDGYKTECARSDRQLGDCYDALAGMKKEVKDWKAAMEELKRDNAELVSKIEFLERRGAELDARHADREGAYAELGSTFDARNKEIERLNMSVRRMRNELTNLAGMRADGKTGLISGEEKASSDENDVVALPGNGASRPVTANKIQVKPWWYGDDDRDATRQPITATEQIDSNANGNDAGDGAALKRFIVIPIGGKQAATHYPLDKKVMTIGRSRNNDIPVASDSVSRMHARIIQTESRVIIEDMGSKNGLVVNSRPKRFDALKHGDTFTIGYREFELFDTSASSPRGPRQPML